MRNYLSIILIGVVLVLSLLMFLNVQDSFAGQGEGRLIKVLDSKVSQALEAYNRGNYMKFREQFANSVKPEISERYFKGIFIDMYKYELGDFKSKLLKEEKSNFVGKYPYLVYEGFFEKKQDVSILVNFKKEDDMYRISRLVFQNNVKK